MYILVYILKFSKTMIIVSDICLRKRYKCTFTVCHRKGECKSDFHTTSLQKYLYYLVL